MLFRSAFHDLCSIPPSLLLHNQMGNPCSKRLDLVFKRVSLSGCCVENRVGLGKGSGCNIEIATIIKERKGGELDQGSASEGHEKWSDSRGNLMVRYAN